jgi:hypothetical protein
MRNPKRRLDVQKVYVLGAGASYSVTKPGCRSPLDKDFTSAISTLKRVIPKWISPAIETVVNAWLDHVPFEDCGLEEAIIRQMGHMQFCEAIHRRRKVKTSEFEFINLIAHLVTWILNYSRETPAKTYGTFAKKVFPPKGDGEDLNRIITFNYDTLLDEHLLKYNSPQKLYFDRIRSERDSSDRRASPHSEPLLLKLHGSANWRCSSDEFKNLLNPPGEDPYWIDKIWKESQSPSPDDDSSPCLIPPLANKPLTSISLFRFLWTRACEYLHEAEEIVICGYSLPPTDSLAQSLFGNIRNKNLRRVTVVDPNPSILKRWRGLLINGYNSKAIWSYHSDFQEYVDESMDS